MRSPVDVYINDTYGDVPVGRAWFTLRRGQITTRFSYEAFYLGRSDAFAIDPMLPLSAGGGNVQGLPGVFRDASPDRWGRHLIQRESQAEALAEGTAPLTLDDVDFLLGVADLSREGALRFKLPGETAWFSSHFDVPPRVDLPKLQDAASSVIQGSSGLRELKYLLDAGSGSLGGARPKASIIDGDRLLLAKFSHPHDEWSVMAWEKVALDIARMAGLAVPAAELVWMGEAQTLLLERFDREGSLAGGRRVPYMSAMTLVGGHDGGSYDYADVAESIRYLTMRADAELHALFGSVALNVALHNVDDHLRNLGYLHGAGGWSASPVFDCNPEPAVGHRRQTTIMGYGDDDADETARSLVDLAAYCDIAVDGAAAMVSSIVRAASQWDVVARRNRIPERERRLFAQMFQRQLEALRKAFNLNLE